MTQLKRANPTTHGACSKCTQPTSNRTGMCVPCRTQICTKCVKPFLPKVPSSMLPKMREMIAEERENEWATEKREHSRGAQEGWSRLSRGELHEVMETMRKRLMGGMKDEEYASFVRSVNQLGDE